MSENTDKEDETDDVTADSASWINCAGELRHLKSKLRSSEIILNEIESAETVDEEYFLIKIKEISKQVKESSTSLLNLSSKILEKRESAKRELEENNEDSTLPMLDPGERSKKLTENQKKYLIRIGPYQPILQRYPTNSSIANPTNEGRKQSRFNPSWFKEYPHLEYSLSKDAAFCFVSSLFGSGPGTEKAENVWIDDGVRSWHKFKSCGTKNRGKLVKHFSSQSHKRALLSYAHFSKTSGHVDALLDKTKRSALIQEEEDLQQNRRIIEILLDITKTFGRQGIAFRGHGDDKDGNFNQMVKLLSRHCPELKHWLNTSRMRPYHATYLSPQSQNEFIEIVGHQVQQRIIRDVKDAGMYSVMADTTPDVSHKDRLAIACRYVDNEGQPRERLMSLTEAKDKTGEGGATEIIESLTKQGLDLNELCFQSYDYTASQSGRFNGVQRKLQDKLERSVPYIPCLAHRSNTVIEHSCKASPIITELFNVLEALFVFFTSSTKRITSLQESIRVLEVDNPLYLRNLSKTRWTARAESIKSVWSSYEAILDSLAKLEESNDCSTRTSAIGLRTKLLRFDFIMSIMFMKNIMYKTKRMTEILQSEDLNVIDAITIMEATVKSLETVNNDADAMNAEIQAAAAFAKKLGTDASSDFQRHHRQRKPSSRIDENPSTTVTLNLESYYRKEFKAVLDTQISTFNDVLENCVTTIKPLVYALQPGKEKSSHQTYEALAKFHPDKERPDPDALMSEIETFKLHFETTNAVVKDISAAAKIAEQQKSVFPLTNRAFRLALTAPVTVAKDERTFSKLKSVKNLCRSRTSDKRLEELMLMACEKDITDEVRLDSLATLWARLKVRRVAISH